MTKLANGATRRTFKELMALPPTDDCILWPHATLRNGYGKMTDPGGTFVYVHVRALELTAGPAPAGHEACHSCRNRACLNPRHLRWGTRSSNSLDRHRDGTVSQAKLTADQVYEIRRLCNERTETQASIARRFGVHVTLIEQIKARRIWRHLPEEQPS